MKAVSFKDSRKSPEDYFNWRVSRALPAVSFIEKWTGLTGKTVLDIGCGYGALSSILLERGAHVTGIEVDKKKLEVAQKLLRKYNNGSQIEVKEEIIPFPDQSFDVVFIFDVIEHIKRPEITIKEVQRVLKVGGFVYVEFTPYYSISGHHLYDYSKLPIHVLSEEKIKQMIFSKKIESFYEPDYYWDLYKSLNKLRISTFQEHMAPFKTLKQRFMFKYPDVFEINLPFLNLLGPFKDYFTMSFEGAYQKV